MAIVARQAAEVDAAGRGRGRSRRGRGIGRSGSVDYSIAKRRGNVRMRGDRAKRVRRTSARFEQRFDQTLKSTKNMDTKQFFEIGSVFERVDLCSRAKHVATNTVKN